MKIGELLWSHITGYKGTLQVVPSSQLPPSLDSVAVSTVTPFRPPLPRCLRPPPRLLADRTVAYSSAPDRRGCAKSLPTSFAIRASSPLLQTAASVTELSEIFNIVRAPRHGRAFLPFESRPMPFFRSAELPNCSVILFNYGWSSL